MNIKTYLLAIVLCFSLSSCDWLFGQHNEAQAQGKNLNDERIYGDKNGDPKQLGQNLDASDEDRERAQKIREKLYGK
ncbi:MAG: hypothetical protein ACFCUI_04235 [Bernardetiaceae bacterium]